LRSYNPTIVRNKVIIKGLMRNSVKIIGALKLPEKLCENMISLRKKWLFVGPYLDDVELGCGGSTAKYRGKAQNNSINAEGSSMNLLKSQKLLLIVPHFKVFIRDQAVFIRPYLNNMTVLMPIPYFSGLVLKLPYIKKHFGFLEFAEESRNELTQDYSVVSPKFFTLPIEVSRKRNCYRLAHAQDKYMQDSSNETKEKNYLVVTPARNEEDMLPYLAKDVVNQSVKPVIWVIVDDGSNDKTWFIIKDFEKEFSWIRGIRLEHIQEREYAHRRYAEVVRKGIKYSVELCRKHNFKYDFLAVVDADVRFESEYFEKLIRVFHTNRRLGIASGFVYEKGWSLEELQKSNAEPRGCALVFRKKFYETISGFLGHSISILQARNRGWHVEVFPSIKAFHRRKSWSRKNYFLTAGKDAYFLNYHPINAFLTGIYYIIKVYPSEGLSYLIGYFKNFLLRKRKIEDEEVKEYFWGSFNRLLMRTLKK